MTIFKNTLEEIDRHLDEQCAETKRMVRRFRHQQFMASDEWKHIRGLKLDLASHRCEKCGVGDPLDVHHLTYDRFGGDELLTDLQVLCRDCHEAVHGRKFGIGYPERDMRIEHENLGY
jgi:5-methylcytosine-specific restriction endonuclease McrA